MLHGLLKKSGRVLPLALLTQHAKLLSLNMVKLPSKLLLLKMPNSRASSITLNTMCPLSTTKLKVVFPLSITKLLVMSPQLLTKLRPMLPQLRKLLDHMLHGLAMKPGKVPPGAMPMLHAKLPSRNTEKKLLRLP
jgi:hypothetical protein